MSVTRARQMREQCELGGYSNAIAASLSELRSGFRRTSEPDCYQCWTAGTSSTAPIRLMAAQLYPSWPPDLTDEEQEHIVASIHDWSLAHGLAIRPPPSLVSLEAETIRALAATAPVTLFPSPFPRSCFEEGLKIQNAYNMLYAAIAANEGWLAGIVEGLLDVDEFISRLWNIHLTVNEKGYVQPPSTLTRGILMIVQDNEQNIFDQKLLEGELHQSHRIPVFRATLASVVDVVSVMQDERRTLIYTPPHAPHYRRTEISVVYYRAGYSPEHYPSEKEWEARLSLEGSAAIKCPSVLAHLAGSKKVQQVLATPSSAHLDRFLADEPSLANGVRETFTNIYPLDESPAGLEARKLALDPSAASHYVLKPQREGGGNNVYRTAIPSFLKSLPESHWKSYILMEIIEPPALRNSILRNGGVQTGGVIEILRNEQAGYVLRTKGRESEEGGVAAGYGCIDSCLLVDV
ncbi:MAG: hypothetical protein M1823_005689 [Watsoniomyces obsoletus]|nr:MAG: hypothetical protein M1823_005689 [Watsoniomyces obsoletus]